VPLAEYERLCGGEEHDDSPWTDEERDLLRREACQMTARSLRTNVEAGSRKR